MPGPNKTPANLSYLRGNPGHRKINNNEPKPKAFAGKPPSHLNKEARKYWKMIVPKLQACGLLTEVDETALSMLCQEYARYLEAVEAINKDGMIVTSPNGYPMQSPHVSIANKCFEKVNRILVQFGMTPSSRSSIQVKDKSKDDEWSGFFNEAE